MKNLLKYLKVLKKFAWGRYIPRYVVLELIVENIELPTNRYFSNFFQLLELFGAGTACIVSPVSHIDFVGEDLQVPSMKQENALWRTFLKHLTDIQYGYVRDHPWALEID